MSDSQEMSKASLIAVRAYRPESDRNFILATWLRGLYYGDTWLRDIPKDIFMGNYHTILENLLARPTTTVVVACLKDDPEVILGYSVFRATPDQSVLDWVFVKSAWRRIGIAKSLIPAKLIAVTHLTKVGKSLLSKAPGVVFNPFII